METLSTVNWPVLGGVALPILILTGGGLLVLLLVAFVEKSQDLNFFVSLVLGATAFYLVAAGWWEGTNLSAALFLFDRLASLFDLIFLLSFLLTLFLSRRFLQGEGREYYALLLFATVGMMLIAHSGDLLLLFLGIEIASLSAYVLAGFRRGSVRSCEAALKYFILGSFASGFLLYGIAFAYGAAGSTSLQTLKVAATSAGGNSLLFLLAAAFLLIGIGFKIAAVPFHFWSPDVYEGSPTPVTAFMASGIKAAGFAALLRIGLAMGSSAAIPWGTIFWALSALTMTVGNLMALKQTNIKRMLAYSSIAHSGYALVGVAAAFHDPAQIGETLGAVLFYLFAYSVMTIGAFGVVVALSRRLPMGVVRGRAGSPPDFSTGSGLAGPVRIDDAEELSDYSSLSEHHPWLAFLLTVFLLSLIGIPPTIGFVGKFYLFAGAVKVGLTGLVVLAVVNSAVSVYYYLGPIVKMYFQKGRGRELAPLSHLLLAGLFFCLFVVLYLGIDPSGLFLIAKESAGRIGF